MQGVIRSQLNLLRSVASHKSVSQLTTRAMSATVSEKYKFETLQVSSPKEYVLHVEMNRPNKLNSMNIAFWREIRECFEQISEDADCRAVVLSGKGKIFTAGLDLADAVSVLFSSEDDKDVGRKMAGLLKTVKDFQSSFSSIEECPKPVIAAIHNACIGGGVDMTAACDIRYCTNDAFFQIKEVDLGLAADVGTLQRFPKVTGNDSLARELAYTARKMFSAEALQCGYVSRVFDGKDSMVSEAVETAGLIAEKSPIAVQGTKVNLIYSRDHSVQESLDYMAVWNAGMLQSSDVMEAASSYMQKKKATFSKL